VITILHTQCACSLGNESRDLGSLRDEEELSKVCGNINDVIA
jgi:hypothetical protein